MPHEEQQHTESVAKELGKAYKRRVTEIEKNQVSVIIVEGLILAAAKHGEFTAVLRALALFLNTLDDQQRKLVEGTLKEWFDEERNRVLVES